MGAVLIFVSISIILMGLMVSPKRVYKSNRRFSNNASNINELKLKEQIKNLIKDTLKKSYDKKGYYSLPDDFIMILDNKVNNKYEADSDITLLYNSLKESGQLLKIISNLIDKCVIELKPLHNLRKITITNNQSIIQDIFIEDVMNAVFEDNHNIPYLILRYSEEKTYDINKKNITYKDLINSYAKNTLKTALLETKQDCTDLEYDINLYISEQNVVINSDDIEIEEAIYNATDTLKDAEDVEMCIEDLIAITIPSDVVPKPYDVSDYFPIIKPIRFLNNKNPYFEDDLSEWNRLLKYEKSISNIKKILTYYLQKKKAIADMKAHILKTIENSTFKSLFYEPNNPANIIPAIIHTFLKNIDFPEYLNFTWEVIYDKESQIVLIDFFMPTSDNFPCYKKCKSINKTTRQIEFHQLSTKEIDEIYQNYICALIINMISTIFEFELPVNGVNQSISEYVKGVAVNGIVRYIDDSDGHEKESCILSILTSEEEISKINLSNVNYVNCFKRLRGLSSANLAEKVAITPIITFDKDDRRFIEGKEIISSLDESVNIAAMDWQDFENLVRDIFEKEFCTDGSEVKITQSSHDGGVDAVVFDPDPIRGGKIVIQAKRYTNVVNVSAVRDLYGTVMNEGANKGILVTTSNFGADSYNFAKDKPITLINGNQLLYLLEKHNIKARIDIQEAKKNLKNI